jgi:hypothetical protein
MRMYAISRLLTCEKAYCEWLRLGSVSSRGANDVPSTPSIV